MRIKEPAAWTNKKQEILTIYTPITKCIGVGFAICMNREKYKNSFSLTDEHLKKIKMHIKYKYIHLVTQSLSGTLHVTHARARMCKKFIFNVVNMQLPLLERSGLYSSADPATHPDIEKI
jgi:hypothetical protein